MKLRRCARKRIGEARIQEEDRMAAGVVRRGLAESAFENSDLSGVLPYPLLPIP